MRNAGRIAATIEVLADFDARRVPVKTCIQDWGRHHRFAGSQDRAWISGLVMDVLRRRRSVAARMADDHPRALVLGTLALVWNWPLAEIAGTVAEEPHGPGALTPAEADALARICDEGGVRELAAEAQSAGLPGDIAVDVAADFPEWLTPELERAFGDNLVAEMQAMAVRAPVDLRVNSLKATPEKVLKAMAQFGANASGLFTGGLRIPAPAAADRTPSLTGLTAYEKGWVEVQDAGSQIAALAAGVIKGKQVLDLCAGGGGKTLALAALMENTGQLYAFDNDARRLAGLFPRAQRAGIRNLQIRSPADGSDISDLAGKMDVVFVDAPCSGTGTWRRHPDTKWRLSVQQLRIRQEEQAGVLEEAAEFVRPGGLLVYVTCSILPCENEDRVAAFLEVHTDFSSRPVLENLRETGQLSDKGAEILSACTLSDGALRLTPLRTDTDGFYISLLGRA